MISSPCFTSVASEEVNFKVGAMGSKPPKKKEQALLLPAVSLNR